MLSDHAIETGHKKIRPNSSEKNYQKKVAHGKLHDSIDTKVREWGPRSKVFQVRTIIVQLRTTVIVQIIIIAHQVNPIKGHSTHSLRKKYLIGCSTLFDFLACSDQIASDLNV